MAKVIRLIHDRLLAALDYDLATGVFTWKERPSNRIHIGDRAGVVVGNGHRYIMIDGEKLQASRLAWFYTHKVWPAGDVKFRNGNTEDCSIENLRDVSRIEGARERGLVSVNTSGFRGVSSAKGGKWQAKITWNYDQINLGASFDTAEEASEAYEEAARRLQESFSTGESRDQVMAEFRLWRRQKTAWNHLNRTHDKHEWTSFEHFCQTVTEFAESRYAMVAANLADAVGPLNFQWTMPITADRGKIGTEYNQAVRDAKRDHYRNKDFVKKYGIDFARYQQMLLDQKGVCAIREKPETKVEHGSIRLLSVDHNHTTGAVRGLLCANCNLAIGYACDDVTTLQKAIGYLRKHAGVETVLPFETTRPDRDWLLVASPLSFGT